MALKQSFYQYRNINGKHYEFLTANGGADGFKNEKANAKKQRLSYRIIDYQFFIEVKEPIIK